MRIGGRIYMVIVEFIQDRVGFPEFGYTPPFLYSPPSPPEFLFHFFLSLSCTVRYLQTPMILVILTKIIRVGGNWRGTPRTSRISQFIISHSHSATSHLSRRFITRVWCFISLSLLSRARDPSAKPQILSAS